MAGCLHKFNSNTIEVLDCFVRMGIQVSSALVLLDHDPSALSVLKKRHNKSHVISHASHSL
jgi:hypothetical protein